MGGYGALRLGAEFPEKFEAISGHSSITGLEQMKFFVEEPLQAYMELTSRPDIIDIMRLNSTSLPALRFDCGKSDLLIQHNRALHKALNQEDIAHIYEEFEGGHEWPYWQKHLEKSLKFFDQHIPRAQ